MCKNGIFIRREHQLLVGSRLSMQLGSSFFVYLKPNPRPILSHLDFPSVTHVKSSIVCYYTFPFVFVISHHSSKSKHSGPESPSSVVVRFHSRSRIAQHLRLTPQYTPPHFPPVGLSFGSRPPASAVHHNKLSGSPRSIPFSLH